MARRAIHLAVLLLLLRASTVIALAALPRQLSFEDRVAAQEAIERVYYSYQEGATGHFEEAVPRELLERKVRTYLKQSMALRTLWKSPVSDAQLRRELDRISMSTRFPDRLEEIYDALNRDPIIILECFVRPVLVRISQGICHRQVP